jgi:hypothetical protein
MPSGRGRHVIGTSPDILNHNNFHRSISARCCGDRAEPEAASGGLSMSFTRFIDNDNHIQ